MPLEATMLIIDNSEYMRNGDYQPTRFDAQSDAVNAIFQTKIDSNPENTVGIMSMAGKSPQVLVTHTKELGQVLKAIHDTSIGESIDIPTAIAVAQLALKHRENKNLRQRIILFVGSPLESNKPNAAGESTVEEKSLVKLAKKLKKNNVSIDVVAFGDGIEEGDKSVLKTFVENASSGDNSHLLSVPPGVNLISDALLSSAVLAADRNIPEEAMGDAPGGPSGTTNDFEFGVDPSLDPELAMALRLSMQEAEARERPATSADAPASSSTPAPATNLTPSTIPPSAVAVPSESAMEDDEDDDEDVELQRALALSQQEPGQEDVDMDDDEDEDEDDEEAAIQKAIQMSMKEDQEQGKK